MLHIVQNRFNFPASWGRAFAVTLFFVTLSAGLFWLDYFRSYSAEVTILVISRPGASQSGADVAENLAELTRTLSFYDRVLSDNDLIDDAFDGYPPDERKTLWNDTVSVKKRDGGSSFFVQAKGDTREGATLLANQITQTLFSAAGLYYNVKTDIDLRIIDGPLVSYALARPFVFGIVSLCTGFLFTVLFFLLLNVAPGFIGSASLAHQGGTISPASLRRVEAGPSLGGERKREATLDEILAEHDGTSEKYAAPEKSYPEFAPGETVPWIDPRKFIPAKPTTLSFENVLPGAKRSGFSGMRAPAPANLPIAPSEMELPVMDETSLPFEFEVPAEESDVLFSPIQGEPLGYPVRGEHVIVTNTKVPTEAESAVPNRDEPASATAERGEPTVDEYKRRLNKLLSGSN
ncbi:MAG: hypothetical protein Q8Q10_02425 [bacterium]|nr:hypothetical protein [bacterium]